MRITSVEVLRVGIPIDWRRDPVVAVVARLSTDEGLEGLGHAIPFSGLHFRSLVVAIEELGELLVGEDPQRPEQVHRKLMPSGTGYGGVDNVAASALDIAVWDLAAKRAGLPLHRMLGGYRSRVPAYASLRLGRTIATADLPRVAASLAEQGFRAMKMNLGGQPSIEAEVARVRAVREAIGPEIHLLADANSRWTPAQAIRVGRELEQFGLYWLEDPVPIYDPEGLAEVRRALASTSAIRRPGIDQLA